MIKILVIGNSFGTDATRYLYGIGRAAGKDIKVVNLYIGGCSLYRHYRNMLSEENAYEFQINGMTTGVYISLKRALLSDEWNYVVMQQCSPKSGEYDTFTPYLNELSKYVKTMAPKAKQYLQMTWTFSDDSPRFKLTPFETRIQMIEAVRDAYTKAATSIKADGIIPSLDAMCSLYEKIGSDTYRDGFHCHFGHTRYMLGCLWFMVLTGNDITGNSFRDFDTYVSEETVELMQSIAKETLIKTLL